MVSWPSSKPTTTQTQPSSRSRSHSSSNGSQPANGSTRPAGPRSQAPSGWAGASCGPSDTRRGPSSLVCLVHRSDYLAPGERFDPDAYLPRDLEPRQPPGHPLHNQHCGVRSARNSGGLNPHTSGANVHPIPRVRAAPPLLRPPRRARSAGTPLDTQVRRRHRPGPVAHGHRPGNDQRGRSTGCATPGAVIAPVGLFRNYREHGVVPSRPALQRRSYLRASRSLGGYNPSSVIHRSQALLPVTTPRIIDDRGSQSCRTW